jgi:hypothetical protein
MLRSDGARKRRRAACALVLALAVVACARTEAVRLDNTPLRPPVAPDKVIVYKTPEDVHAHYEEVAILSASGDAVIASQDDVYASLRKKAGELGANGVILQVPDDVERSKFARTFGLGSINQNTKAIAIFVPSADSIANKR